MLSKLPEQRHTVLLMNFFLKYTDIEIEKEYRSIANYWKYAALKQLRKEWLKTENKKQEVNNP